MLELADVNVDPRHWIGGERVASADTFEDLSPIDGTVLGQVVRGGQAEADAAVAAAQDAFPAWARMGARARGEILHRVADLVEQRLEDFAQLETRDNGSLLRSHRRGVMPRVAMNIRFFAEYAVNDLKHPEFETRGHTNVVSWDPAGVTAIVTPWNAPLMLATWRIGPALAAGDTVVLKPPEWAPLTASLFADITAEAGMPPGVFNVVQGIGTEAGAALVSHAGVARIAFTGSVPTAKAVARAAADNLTPLSFELGGKSPTIIMDDADLGLAAEIAAEQYDNAGQVCLAGTRLLVHESIAAEFAERLEHKVREIRQGDPREESTDLGPQIHPVHLERIAGYVDRARNDGATIAFGGERIEPVAGGFYYAPTLIMGAASGSEILTHEVFGPVLTMQTFASEDEAIDLANNTDYGLAATLVCGDRPRAERIAGQLVAGTVWVNCFFVRDLRAPFGGSRRSGIGREGGTWSFDFYADVKNTCYSPIGWR
ncbi:MAG: aldehyde dehydrogenase [Candidatus Nanopelagicales bacterium]|nr:aldehyde dehydrogenase [Candidatus Nanopelagicales bacterium]